MIGASDLVAEVPSSSSNYRVNAKDWAKPFTARLLEPGLCSYEDSGCGKVLLRKETIDRCVQSFIGRPVVVKQNRRGKFVHAKATPDNMKEIGHGYVTDVFYNAGDGWWYCRGLVDTEEAANAIKKVGKSSCGYGVKSAGPGGLWHDIPYEEEILEFSGEHLAIVDSPRYEEATIRLNSKNQPAQNMNVFKWLKKKPASANNAGDAAAAPAAGDQSPEQKAAALLAAENAKKATGDGEDIDGETTITFLGLDGKPATASLAQLIEAHNSKLNGVDIGMEDEVVCNGKSYKMNALVEAFDKWTKVNSTDGEKKKVEDAQNAKTIEADKAAAAALQDAEEKKKLETANNGKASHFNVLLNASNQPAAIERGPMNSLTERLARGRSLFGSKK